MSTVKTLAEPKEFSEDQDFKVQQTRPSKPITIMGPGGKPVTVDVIEKSATWSVPEDRLRAEAFNIGLMQSGKVIVTDREGKHLAKYVDAEQARAKLTAANVKLERLPGGKSILPKVVETAEEEQPVKKPIEPAKK